MEVSASNIAKCGDDEKALMGLLEAFSSDFSLEQIASAYCKGGRNADLAVRMLCDMQGSISNSSTSLSNGEAMLSDESSDSSDGYILKQTCDSNGKFRTAKQKWRPVSGGTVSNVLGRSYVKSIPAASGSCMTTKPLKLDAKGFPMSELWGEEPKLDQSNHDRMHKSMEDFLFKMLGDGFQLERESIQKVLETCGYDMQKSMERLLDPSAVISDKRSKYGGRSSEKFTDAWLNSEGASCQKNLQSITSDAGANRASTVADGRELIGQGQERNNLQKEVLDALFNVTERPEKLSRRVSKAARRSVVYGEPVVGPPSDFTFERNVASVDMQQDSVDVLSVEEQDDEYQLLRKAWKEYRTTMNQYYKAAGDAFAKGEYERANKLMDRGHFFRDKAHEVDEESTQKIFETKNVDTQDEMLLDLHDYGAKDAVRSLKTNLPILAGIPSFKYLKVIIETNKEDDTKGARRRLIMKLLDKGSIKWSEGGDAGTIRIHLDDINPKLFC